MPTLSWDELDKSRFYVFGPTLFLGVRAILYPTTLIKTRLQVQSAASAVQYQGTAHAFRVVLREEGVRGLYKGFGANAIGILSGNVYITIYEMVRQRLLHRDVPVVQANLVGGACASLVSQTIVVPVDVVSQKVMVDRDTAGGVSARRVFADILRREGVRGLYRGYTTSLMTYAPSSAIWWSAYGFLNDRIHALLPLEGLPAEVTAQAVAGSLSGVTAAVLTNPMDVVRTNQQVDGHPTARHTLRAMLAQDGPGALMRGVTARMSNMASSGVLMVITYELIKRLSRKTAASE